MINNDNIQANKQGSDHESNNQKKLQYDSGVSSGSDNNNNNQFMSCDLEIFERNNYFFGQLLTHHELNQEQEYFNKKRQTITRLISGTGIVCGLDFEILNPDPYCFIVKLDPGMAIDCCGQDIIVSEQKAIEIKIDKEKILSSHNQKRIGLFIARKDIWYSPVSDVSHWQSKEKRCCESKIQENYILYVKPLDKFLEQMEFDKKTYCINDNVVIELIINQESLTEYGLDIKNTREIEVNVSSKRNREGLKVKLSKVQDKIDIYRGQLKLTKEAAENNNELPVYVNDTITAIFGKAISAQAFVNSSEESIILNQRRILDEYHKNKLSECVHCVNENEKSGSDKNIHGVLLGVLSVEQYKKEHNRYVMTLNIEETLLNKKIIYNNTMLYEIFKEHDQCIKEQQVQSGSTMISDVYSINIEKLRDNCYIITNPIDIMSDERRMIYKKRPKSPPLIYLGRVPPDDNEKVLHFEDYEPQIVIDSRKYQANTPEDEYLCNKAILNSIEPIIFKPVEINKDSFRMLIARNPSNYNYNGTKDSNLVIRWYAMVKL